jgi:hypothetical protein
MRRIKTPQAAAPAGSVPITIAYPLANKPLRGAHYAKTVS